MWDLMLEYLKTGRLGPLYLGQSRRDVLKLLDEPQWIYPSEGSVGYTYDDLFVNFEAGRLESVVVELTRRPLVVPKALALPSPERLGARSMRRVLTDVHRAAI